MKGRTFAALLGILGVLFLAGLLGGPCQAQSADSSSSVSLWDIPHRLYISAGGNYDWYKITATEAPLEFRQEWSAGLYLAYSLTQHVTLAGSSVYGLDTKLLRTSLGVRLNLYRPPKRAATGG